MIETKINLIPNIINPTPDYYCTWQTQLYATNDGKPIEQRRCISEKALFENEKPFGWAYFYEKAHKDLFFVMDDSWDVPLDNDETYYGSLVLNSEKFPQSTTVASNAEALKRLSDKIKNIGWKGLGGWDCAQESPQFKKNHSEINYWTERLLDADISGFSYWKVDWGERADNIEFRQMLTELGRKYAPELIIEHALLKDLIPCSDVFRTYDVPAIMSIPMTMEKLSAFCDVQKPNRDYMGLVNCEDEAYIAAAGGFSMGIMRHPYIGSFVNGKKDMSFPSIHRNLKTKICEITRAAHWHRIAPAFALDGTKMNISNEILSDSWEFIHPNEEIESWWFAHPFFDGCMKDSVLTKSAPAAIARGMELPTVISDGNGNVPYIVASKNPNGTCSVATLGRTLGRNYEIPKCDIMINCDAQIFGIFGEYKSLTIKKTKQVSKVLIQDLAGDRAFDITDDVQIKHDRFIIPGELIGKIGTSCNPVGDTSEPGAVIKIIK